MSSTSPDSSTSFAARRFDCPNCGAPVPFQASTSIFAVCGHCRSMVVRKDFNVQAFGQMAELPQDLSPLQIGTKGYHDGRAFTLIGRLRLHWGEGSWTEWYADFGQGKTGWVAEAMGFYMVSFEQNAPEVRTVQEDVAAGKKLKIAGTTWLVKDVKSARCIAAEGELPHVAPPGWQRTGIDLVGDEGQFGSVEVTDDGRSFYTGAYATFDDLNFTELRKVPGWQEDGEITRNRSDAMGCPSCGAPVALRAQGLTMTAVCGSCGSVLDSSTAHLQNIGKVQRTTLELKPLLPIGTRGLLRNEMWEVIGFMKRKDQWSFWHEYLLFNPWQGFRWLVSFNGHWTYVTTLPAQPNKPVWNGEHFRLFAAEEVVVTDVLGEFYWRVKAGERVILRDYIAPPLILSSEESLEYNEVNWSLGDYISAEDVAAAFKVQNLPRPSGILLNQPNPHAQRWKQVRGKFFMLVLVYAIVQMLFMGSDHERQVVDTELLYQGGAADKTLISETFSLPAGSAPVHISATGSLPEDTYLALKGSLVNKATQQAVPLTLPLTNYATAPGGDQQDIILPAIPKGEYYLRFDPDASASIEDASVALRITQGGLFWSNFWMGLALICLWPFFLMIRNSGFEKRRWSQSDFSA